jgi:hypothetical protein
MEHVKQFFDLLDYMTIRAVLYALMLAGAIALIRACHPRRRPKNARSRVRHRRVAVQMRKNGHLVVGSPPYQGYCSIDSTVAFMNSASILRGSSTGLDSTQEIERAN